MKRGRADIIWGLGLSAVVVTLIGVNEWREWRKEQEQSTPPSPPRGTYR